MGAIAEKLPQDTEAERMVLAGLMLECRGAGLIFEMLRPEHFADDRHGVIYRTLKELWEGKLPCDLPTTQSILAETKRITDAGEAGYVASICEGVYTKAPFEFHAKRVREKAALRDVIHVAEKMQRDAFDAGEAKESAAVLLDSGMTALQLIASGLVDEKELPSMRDGARDAVASVYNEAGEPEFLSGIAELDELVNGFRPGELVILTAETGVGKTFFAMQLSNASCKHGRHVLFASGEMLASHLMGRALAGATRIPFGKLRRPATLCDDDKFRLMTAAAEQCARCRVLDHDLTLVRLRIQARKMHAGGGLGGIFVDYDELVETPGRDEWDAQRLLMVSLKNLAMELRVPVFVVSQLRKALGDDDRKHPTLQRLYGSGAKAKHASIVLYLDRPFVQELKGDETAAVLFVLKNRDGKMGRVECVFDVRTFRLRGGSETPPPTTPPTPPSLPYRDD